MRDEEMRPGHGACGQAGSREPAAFTLVEVLIVLAIVALLVTLLLPVLLQAEARARSNTCLNNLRAMVIAAETYANNYDGRYPIAYYNLSRSSNGTLCAEWDFRKTRDEASGEVRVGPGILWDGSAPPEKVHQCPSFRGAANALGDPSTGYNYNTSYIGHGELETPLQAPARIDEVQSPNRCALFGDGQFAGGANKFMRAPWADPHHDMFGDRHAGTQGYRHLAATNVSFCDGHVVSQTQCHKQTHASKKRLIAPGTGFLSADNSLYDLE